ncbi:hypothetical protein ACJMK2_008135 [Sinanodonta woodiana]|uniref:Uncharacterized protein n=1 Tax=Sinanodonta woodiana TaxID=1069815 RepID=A0ABD3VNP8_SINWO
MASSETPSRLLGSPSDIRTEIDRLLSQDGLNAQCTDEEKLFYVWRLYQTAEEHLQTAIENEEKLKRSQAEEMQEVENYVEHIRHLSDEREALIQELETENDQLKQEIEALRQEQNASTASLRDESAEMLIQQGLEEIASAPTSEQIAFLLVERARLLDELEAEQGRTMSDGRASTELQRTLDTERKEFEDELNAQRRSMDLVRQQLKQEHEEEINVLMDENSKMEDELALAREKVVSLEARVSSLEDELKKERENHDKEPVSPSTPDIRSTRGRSPSPLCRSPSDVALRQIISEKTKLEGEILGYKATIRNQENEKKELQEKINKLDAELEEAQMKTQQLQMKNRSLKAELEESEQQLEDTENHLEEVAKERDSLKDTVRNLEDEHSADLKDIVNKLNIENKDLNEQVNTLRKQYEDLVTEKEDIASQNLALIKGEEELKHQLETLKVELNDALNSEEFKQKVEELERTKSLLDSKSFECDELKERSETLTKENKELFNQFESIQVELDSKKVDAQVLAKQEIILQHLRDQSSKFSKELTETKSKLTETDMKTINGVATDRMEVNIVLKKESEDLKAKLQLTLNELSKARSVIEQERSENSELTARVMELEQLLEENSHAMGLDSRESTLTELELKVKELEKLILEKNALEDELEEQKQKVSELTRQVEELDVVKVELEDSKDMLDQEKRSRGQIEGKMHELEQQMEDQKVEADNLQHILNEKIKSLENRVQALQDDLFAAQDELTSAQEKYEKTHETYHLELKEQALKVKAAEVEFHERLHKEEIKRQEAQYQEDIKRTEVFERTTAAKDESSLVELRLEKQKVENLEKQIEAMKIRITEAQKQVEELTKEKDSAQKELKLLREANLKYTSQKEDKESMRSELEAVRRELDHLRTSAQYDSEERQQHMDRIKTLEDYTRQLELDNRELANKLSETLVKLEQTEEQMQREKRNTLDRQQQSNRQLYQVESDLEVANNKIRELREEIQKKQSQLMKIESDKVGQSAKSETTIARLETELNELKQYHRKELDKLTEKVEQTNKESKELKNSLREKEQELLSRQHEFKRQKTQIERLEAQLQTEVKIRTDLENRNTALDQEISKVWAQVRSLMEKNSSLETTKRTLEDEIEKFATTSRQAETSFAQKAMGQEATVKSLQNRAETAEKRADHLQRELNDVSLKLQGSDLQDKRDRMTALKTQLEGEKLQRSLLDQSMKELQQQVTVLRQRETKLVEQNRELHHTIMDMESKLEDVQERSKNALEMQQHKSEMGKRSMMDQISRLQDEIKKLQYDLLTANEKRELQDRKYEERKTRTKAKLLKASPCKHNYNVYPILDYYHKDKTRITDQINRMDEDLRLTRATLRKELDWKERMDKNYKDLLSEKRELLTQLNEQEESIREKARMISMLQIRTKFLEEENTRLHDRIDAVSQQKQGLDKMLKEYKLGKDRDAFIISASDECDTNKRDPYLLVREILNRLAVLLKMWKQHFCSIFY